jgi:hypothetical protein
LQTFSRDLLLTRPVVMGVMLGAGVRCQQLRSLNVTGYDPLHIYQHPK